LSSIARPWRIGSHCRSGEEYLRSLSKRRAV